ncbi:MAG: adenosylcobinamide-phosphate synthase CbiB [Mangrovicoccus sp.]|nr:adenosylcobinamide-phosphate synthase CbiB [Mangrovicoccus sp.]
MSSAMMLILALALDAWLGEPDWLWKRLPHPAVLMGRLIGWADKRLNPGGPGRGRGILALGLFIAVALMLAGALRMLPFAPLLEILLAAMLLAQRSLVEHVAAVALALRQSVEDGRRSVAMIVGRDTADMTPADIARAAIESAAENLSDGVVAPAFWFLIAGLPGILVYKMVNTADSMIGYRTPRHEGFGWASARFDDLLNLIPARLTALIIAALHKGLGHWSAITTEARRHRSPNAGWPEAAMARALNAALSGPRRYHGRLTQDPFVYPQGRKDLGARDIEGAVAVLWRVWWALLAMGMAAAIIAALL